MNCELYLVNVHIKVRRYAEIRRDLKQYVKILKVGILAYKVLYPGKIAEADTCGDVVKKIKTYSPVPNVKAIIRQLIVDSTLLVAN